MPNALAVICDDCGRGFTKEHPGVLEWWCHLDGNVVHKIRVRHHVRMKPDGCYAVDADAPGLHDTASWYPTMRAEDVRHILHSFRFRPDDEEWLRSYFGIGPKTLEERVEYLEAEVHTLLQRVDKLTGEWK